MIPDPEHLENGAAVILWILAVLGHVHAWRFSMYGAEVWVVRHHCEPAPGNEQFIYYAVRFLP